MNRTKSLPITLGLAVALQAALWAGHAHAQQATNSPSATQVSKDVWAVRERSRFTRFDQDMPGGDRVIEEWTHETIIMYGLTGDLAAMLHVPVTVSRSEGPGPANDDHAGVGDMMLMGQYRFFQDDSGPINTFRAAALFGVEVPSGDEQLSSDSFDPFLGLSFTQIDGRHGTGGSILYKFNTGDRDDPIAGGNDSDDALFYNTSYLYRLAPEAYQADTTASFYFQNELNGLYETNGDHELFYSPGLLYEATNWAAEVSVQLPIYQEVDDRPEAQWAVVLGIRLLF